MYEWIFSPSYSDLSIWYIVWLLDTIYCVLCTYEMVHNHSSSVCGLHLHRIDRFKHAIRSYFIHTNQIKSFMVHEKCEYMKLEQKTQLKVVARKWMHRLYKKNKRQTAIQKPNNRQRHTKDIEKRWMLNTTWNRLWRDNKNIHDFSNVNNFHNFHSRLLL